MAIWYRVVIISYELLIILFYLIKLALGDFEDSTSKKTLFTVIDRFYLKNLLNPIGS